jgi:hypothetical protein
VKNFWFWRKDARDHLDANLSQGWTGPWDSLDLGWPINNVECDYEERLRKRMQLVLLGWCMSCGSEDNWGWLKFSVIPTQKFTLEYIIASGYFADCFSGCCVLSRCSRLEVFNKVMRASWARNFLWSLKYLAFSKWMQVVHHWWTGAHHVCVSRENWGQLEFPRVLCLNFPLT